MAERKSSRNRRGTKGPKSRQAPAYKGQKASQAKPKTTVLAGKGYAISTISGGSKPRSEVAKTFGPSSTSKPSGGSNPSPRYGYASRRARGADTSRLTKPEGSSSGAASSTKPSRNPGSDKPDGTKTPDKTPTKVTAKTKKTARKYASVLETARTKVDGKKMNAAERKKVVDARAKLKKMRAKLVKSGVGKYSKKPNKRGGKSTVGIYRELTGKKYKPKDK